RTVAHDAEAQRKEQRHRERDREYDAAEHDGVVEVGERHDRRVVQRGSQPAQRLRQQELVSDPVEQRIEQESERDEQRPPQHAARERDVEEHEGRENDRVVQVQQRREAEERAQHDARRKLTRGALRMQRTEQRLNQLYQREHSVDLRPARVPVGARLIDASEREELSLIEGTSSEAESSGQSLNSESIRN